MQLKEQTKWVPGEAETPGHLGSWLEGAPGHGAERRLPLLPDIRIQGSGPWGAVGPQWWCVCGLGEPGRHIISSPWSHAHTQLQRDLGTWAPRADGRAGSRQASASPEFRSSNQASGSGKAPPQRSLQWAWHVGKAGVCKFWAVAGLRGEQTLPHVGRKGWGGF